MSAETILIIEDDATLLRGLKDNFEFKGYRTQTAADGEAGLDAALHGKPDLIILDIMLPKVNGYEICRAVREQGLDMPIIMLTAKGQEADIVRGLNLGADDYMTKPFSIKELLARAHAFLRRYKVTAAEVYHFGDWRLDVGSHRLLRGESEVVLTPKEFGLLQYLLSRAGRALTRDDIMAAVWGSDVLVTARSVDRSVTTLRSKIEPDPRHPTYIQTIRDIGYRFEIPQSDEAEAAAEPAALDCGARLGRYEILSILGSGGMARVYRARDSRLDREVALKVLSRQLSQDPSVLKRFQREARAVAALAHPNIVAIYDVGKHEGLTFAVTELLEGETLSGLLGRGALDQVEAVRICSGVAEGLAEAHGKGIIHRDIKPGNIFLTREGGIKILDFGLARLEPSGELGAGDDSTVTPRTLTGTMVGTVDYMSPEQVRGQVADARSDLFSVGCVFYEMLTGSRPFRQATSAETMAAILNHDPSPPSKLPGDLCRVVMHCLEKDPANRFQSAGDLIFALQGIGV